MPNIFNADDGAISGSAGIKLSSDTSGVLNIQTNGTTAISISASQVVSFPATSGFSFAGQVTFAAGTAAAPSISVTGDTNTGIYFPAADTIAFTEGGVESMRIDASGNLALGSASILGSTNRASFTNTVSAKSVLALQNTSTSGYSAIELYDNGGTQQGAMGWGNASVAVTGAQSATYLYSTGPITFLSGGTTERMRLDSSGNLGLGVTPAAWYTADNATRAIQISTTGALIANASAMRVNQNWYFDTSGTPKYLTNGAATQYLQNAGIHSWHTAASGSAGGTISATQAMTLDASGNLGVGTTSPSTFGGGGLTLGSTSSGKNLILNSSSAGNNGLIQFLDTGGANAFQLFATTSQITLYGYGSRPMTFVTSDTERARITAAGNLGIGTTSPAYRLQVQKTATATPAFMIGGGFFGGPRLQVYGLDDNGTAWMGMGTDMSTGIYELSIYYPNASGNGRISFGTYNGTTYTERMSLSQAGNLNVVGALSKGSGSFRIPHPLKEETHDLVHSFIEGPQADLIYSGKVQLEDGVATVNIDAASGMTEGTFVVLCRDIRCFTNNETDWDNVRGKVVGNLLTIECQNPDSDAVISWMVIGERQDKHMYDTDWTDADGKVIVEPLKPVIKKSYN